NEHDYDLDSILSSSEPVIDLHLPAFETSIANFSRAIANFTARSVAEITQRRDAHDKELKRLAVRAQIWRKRRSILKHEREEAEEAESAVAALRRRVESEREVITSLDANIQTLRARVANLRKLLTCERITGLFIEGVSPEQLLIRYTIKGGDNSRSTHEASFVLDLSSQQTFKVLTSTPQLPTMPILLDQLNESGDVYTFIKRVRQAYVKLFS
ncbi:hypothetical protein EI94DRAFT_1743136, partial [Lactarius quietus]